MEKYNFSAMKFDEIEKRITGLEARSARLEAENIRLREENETLKGKTCQTRDLTHEIEDYSKLQALFGLDIVDGVLKPTDSRTKINANFQTFYVNGLRALKPYVRKNTSKGERYRIVGTPLKNLSDREWKIAVETVNAIVDTIYYASMKMTEKRLVEQL